MHREIIRLQDNLKNCNIAECVEEVSSLISNNLFTLKIELLLKCLDEQDNYYRKIPVTTKDVALIGRRCTDNIVGSLSTMYKAQDVDALRYRYQKVIENLELLSLNFNESLLRQTIDWLSNLSNYWTTNLRRIIAEEKIEGDLYNHFRIALFKYLEIDTILDVGANVGQYALSQFSLGYKGRINSFEPLASTFDQLSDTVNNHEYDWVIHNIAFGNENGVKEFYECENSACSTFNPTFQSGPMSMSGVVKSAKVEISKLDDYLDSKGIAFENAYLKMDVENFDREVLLGSARTLEKVRGAEVECRNLYYVDNQWLAGDIIAYMNQFDLCPVLYPDLATDLAVGQMIGSDIIFLKRELVQEISWIFSIQNFKNRVLIRYPSKYTSSLHWL